MNTTVKECFISDKIKIILAILFVYSPAIENIIFKDINITMITYMFLVVSTITGIIRKRRILKLNEVDIFIYMFVIVSLINSLINDTITRTLLICVNSLSVYFIGRYILVNNESEKILIKTIDIVSYIIILVLMKDFFISGNKYKTSINGISSIAVGELIAIFIVSNYIMFRKNMRNKKIINILNMSIGMFSVSVFLGTRGALIASIISIILYKFIVLKERSRSIIIVIIVGVLYVLFNIYSSNIIIKYPSLNRFTINSLKTDPSIVGHSGYIGRSDVIKHAINEFNDNPIIGVGFGNTYPHNIFLDVIASLGIIGILIFIISIIITVVKYVSRYEGKSIILIILLMSFIYRQSSFGFEAHKVLFLFWGMHVTNISYFRDKNKLLN